MTTEARTETPDENTALIPRPAQQLSPSQLRSNRFVKWMSIATVTCALIAFSFYIYLGTSKSLVDEGELPTPREIRLNSSISTIPDFLPPFRAKGRQILDAFNSSVRLKSINWYGASDIYFVPSGLDIQHRHEIATLIRRMGFNSVRLPYSDEMVVNNPSIPEEHLLANPDLIGLRALDVYAAAVQSLTAAGILVIINNHITQATWCCGINPCDSGWANDWLGPLCRIRQTETGWITHLQTAMSPHVNNPLVIGADLRNEVHGLWGTMHWDSWAAAAERAAETLLRMNQNWLMIIGGTSSANDLSGVRNRPIRLSVPGRVVYSAHVYSWSGWGELAPFSGRSFEEFAAIMRQNWAYLLEEDIAPVWVGEFGSPAHPTKGDLNYWKHLIRFLDEVDAQWGYWAINPSKPAKNETETYGLVKYDWATVRWDYRLHDLLQLGLNFTQLRHKTA
jgi:endoglucanase